MKLYWLGCDKNMKLRAVRHNAYNLDSNYNPILYYPYVKEDTLNKYNFYVVEEHIDEMVLIFGGMTRLRLPFTNSWNCTVDWGDGVVQNFISSTRPDHTYSTLDNYTVKITGLVRGFNFVNAESSYAIYLKEIVKIDNIGLVELTFQNCKSLTKVHDGVFDNFNKEDITSFWGCFTNCSSLKYIPPYLFKDFINVTSFYSIFNLCIKLESIPNGIFDNCINVLNFGLAFNDCGGLQGNIPIGLFDSCIKVTNFQQTFYRCVNLTGFAPTLWLRTNPTPDGFVCFTGCINLSNYNDIPYRWRQ